MVAATTAAAATAAAAAAAAAASMAPALLPVRDRLASVFATAAGLRSLLLAALLRFFPA
jgi:hypothetical protein